MKNRGKVKKALFVFIGLCGLALITVIMFLALNSTISMRPIMTVLIALMMAALIVAFRYRLKIVRWLFRHKTLMKIAVIMIVIAAVLFRFAPLIFDMQYQLLDNLNDVGVHYYSAQRMAEGWLDEKTADYMKAFPYLAPYAVVLTIFYKIMFSNIVVAILFSNLLFDVVGGLFCYLLLKKTKIRGAGWIGVLLWCVNPMSIIACWYSMNLVLVNMLLMILLYLAVIFLEAMQRAQVRKMYFVATMIGGLIFVANLFRPLFSVLAIALSICILIYLFSVRRYKQLPVLIVMVAALIVPTFVTNKVVAEVVGDDVLGSSGGWSFYVGSNYSSQGSWVAEDRDYFWGTVIPESSSMEEAQERIKQEGLQRYLDLTPLQFVNHLANKLGALFGDVVNSIYDIKQTFGIQYRSKKHDVLSTIVAVFYNFLLILTFLWIVKHYHKLDMKMFFITLVFLGLVAAFLIVEVMNRYVMIFYPLLIIYASILLGTFWQKFRHKI